MLLRAGGRGTGGVDWVCDRLCPGVPWPCVGMVAQSSSNATGLSCAAKRHEYRVIEGSLSLSSTSANEGRNSRTSALTQGLRTKKTPEPEGTGVLAGSVGLSGYCCAPVEAVPFGISRSVPKNPIIISSHV